MPDSYIDHMSPAQQLEEAGLTAEKLVSIGLDLVEPATARDAA